MLALNPERTYFAVVIHCFKAGRPLDLGTFCEPTVGIEPTTCCLQDSCSNQTELCGQCWFLLHEVWGRHVYGFPAYTENPSVLCCAPLSHLRQVT